MTGLCFELIDFQENVICCENWPWKFKRLKPFPKLAHFLQSKNAQDVRCKHFRVSSNVIII